MKKSKSKNNIIKNNTKNDDAIFMFDEELQYEKIKSQYPTLNISFNCWNINSNFFL
jgi:hypothetical protein